MSGKTLKYGPVLTGTYDLFELDSETLAQIEGARVKGAGLTTVDKTFKLKVSETSNSLLILDGNTIKLTTNKFIEVTRTMPKYAQVLQYLTEYRTEEEILQNCQISPDELSAMLSRPEKWHLIGSGPWQALNISETFALVDNLLVYLNADESRTSGLISVSDILKGAQGIIPAKFLTADHIELGLKLVGQP